MIDVDALKQRFQKQRDQKEVTKEKWIQKFHKRINDERVKAGYNEKPYMSIKMPLKKYIDKQDLKTADETNSFLGHFFDKCSRSWSFNATFYDRLKNN